jgi:hypothetical protein
MGWVTPPEPIRISRGTAQQLWQRCSRRSWDRIRQRNDISYEHHSSELNFGFTIWFWF